MTCYSTPIRMANIQKTNSTRRWRECREKGTLNSLLEMPNDSATLENSSAVSYKIKHTPTPYYPTITFLGIYPEEVKNYIDTKTCTQMFIAALLIIAKTWKQPRCPFG